MIVTNESGGVAGWTLGFQPDGRELLVAVVKRTYRLPEPAGAVTLADEQLPLVASDEFTGEPGLSAPTYECDYAHRKLRCDVLLNGSAHAPGGRAVRRCVVGLRVGRMEKSFRVVGDRVWRRGLLGARVSSPKRFTSMPISYDRAFGGVDGTNPKKPVTLLANPVGVGYHRKQKSALGKPAPNTEETRRRIRSHRRKVKPMSFGSLGRNWSPRADFAGTYDDKWLDGRAPFFPDDFDYRYFQAAPPDQQIPFPTGGEPVVLTHLTPHGVLRFSLPDLAMPMLVVPYSGEHVETNAVADTILFEPDAGRFSVTWRACWPLRRNAFEIVEVVAGGTARSRRRKFARERKRVYGSLSDVVASPPPRR